ncbi:uncharacterized protein LOC144128233 isoform X1 [Amblyomma americanum]
MCAMEPVTSTGAGLSSTEFLNPAIFFSEPALFPNSDVPSTSTGARPRGRPRKTEEEKAQTKARRAEAMRLKRREDPELRAREVRAMQQRRLMDPNFKAKEAAAKRRRREEKRRKLEESAQQRGREAEDKHEKRQAVAEQTARRAEHLEVRACRAAARRHQRQVDASLRVREADAKRQRRQRDPQLRAREAEARRTQRRERDPEWRARETEAKRLKRRADAERAQQERSSQHVANMFERRFTENPLGCSVCDRLYWHKADMAKPLPEALANADAFPTGVSGFKVCHTCLQDIRRDSLPNFAPTNGYVHPSKPADSPKLDLAKCAAAGRTSSQPTDDSREHGQGFLTESKAGAVVGTCAACGSFITFPPVPGVGTQTEAKHEGTQTRALVCARGTQTST